MFLKRVISSAPVATLLPALMAGMLVAGCSHSAPVPADRSMPLVVVGDSILTLADVTSRIPAGLSADDSLSLFSSIVGSWMQDVLLREMAADNAVDMDRIDRMTADYRNRLIINEYLRYMERASAEPEREEDVKAVYAAQAASLRTEHPLVKGVYIKLPSDADRLDDVRRWMKSASRAGLENIEKHALADAVEYDRFTDRWVDWQEIESQIPHTFGDADAFLRDHRDFETSDRASTYMLHITEVLPAGSAMPYDFAAPLIREASASRRRAAYGHELTSVLAEKARKEGRLSTPGYDLRTHKTINNTKDTEK